jgi:hypothetical protein
MFTTKYHIQFFKTIKHLYTLDMYTVMKNAPETIWNLFVLLEILTSGLELSEMLNPGLIGPVPVAHLCNHGYSGGRVQKDCGSKPAGANSL